MNREDLERRVSDLENKVSDITSTLIIASVVLAIWGLWKWFT